MKNKASSSSAGGRERSFEGLPVGAGVAIGTVYRHDSRAVIQVREHRIPATKVRSEQHRVLKAAAEATSRIEALQSQAKRMSGPAGVIVINPTAATLANYRLKRARFLKSQQSLKKLKTVAAVTRDGFRVGLQANIGGPADVAGALEAGAEGVGLLRSEFMFMNRADLPSEEEQFSALSKVVKQMRGKPVTVRTLDVGADKLGEAFNMKPGPNPALGLRAIRFSLSRRKMLLMQLSAILRASAFGPVRILLPMVCMVDEVRQVRRMVTRIVAQLKRRGVKISDPPPPLGIMIEIPGAALAADALAAESDFFAIGTNDLTQYTLAEAAMAAGIPVSVCGEMAGDERMTPILLGFGITDLSMPPNSLPRVKKRILDLNLSAISGRVRRITSESNPARVWSIVEDLGNGG